MGKILKYLFCSVFLFFTFAVIGAADVGKFDTYGSGRQFSISGKSKSRNSSASSSRRRISSYNTGRITEGNGNSERNFSSRIHGKIFAFFLTLIIISVVKIINKKKNKNGYFSDEWVSVPDNSQDIIAAIKKYDTSFNPEIFLQWVKEVFLKLQYAWAQRDLQQIRPFESKELYARHEQQIKEYKQSGRINIKEHTDINNAHLFMFKKDKESETLSVALNVRMADYIIDEYTHKVLNGKADKDYCFNYLYIFKRQTASNIVGKQQTLIVCPNCGAPNSVSGSGKCEYCSFKITSKDSGWVLIDIMDIKQPDDCGRGGVFIESMGEK